MTIPIHPIPIPIHPIPIGADLDSSEVVVIPVGIQKAGEVKEGGFMTSEAEEGIGEEDLDLDFILITSGILVHLLILLLVKNITVQNVIKL
jgi:hypothetical protein